jgi:hypothetical protein
VWHGPLWPVINGVSFRLTSGASIVKNRSSPPGRTKTLVDRGADPVGNSIDDDEPAIRSELAKWRRASKAAGVKPG